MNMEPFNEHGYLVPASRDCPHDIHLRHACLRRWAMIYITQYPHSLSGLEVEGAEYNRGSGIG